MSLPDSTRSIRARISRPGGDSQRLIKQGHGLLPAAGLVPLRQRVGVAGAGPVQFEPVARPLAEGLTSLEVGHGLALVSHGLRQKDERAVAQ